MTARTADLTEGFYHHHSPGCAGIGPSEGMQGSLHPVLTAVWYLDGDRGTGVDTDGEGSVARIGAGESAGAGYPDFVISPQRRAGRYGHAVGSGSARADGNPGEGFQGSSPFDHFDVHR